MTPFDPHALLAMLLAFYPIVSVAELRRARAERPEYFAAGVLFGTVGEKLRLPDGRVFDLIFNADGPVHLRRWQVIEPGPGDAGDPFGLDVGPLTDLDPDIAIPPVSDPTFAPLVAGAIGEVHVLEGRMGDAATTMATEAGAGNLGPALEQALGDAQWAHNQGARSLEGANPGELLDHTDGLARQLDSRTNELPEPPDDIPENPPVDPGPPPGPHDDPPDQGPPQA